MMIYKQNNAMDSLILSHNNIFSNGVWSDTNHDRRLCNADMVCSGPLVVIRESLVSTDSDNDGHLHGTDTKINKILSIAKVTHPILISESDAGQQTQEIMPDVPVALKTSGEKCTQAISEIMAENSFKHVSGQLGLSDFMRAFVKLDKPTKQVNCDFIHAEVDANNFLGPFKPTICYDTNDIDKTCDCAKPSLEIDKPHKHATCDSGHHADLIPRVSFIHGKIIFFHCWFLTFEYDEYMTHYGHEKSRCAYSPNIMFFIFLHGKYLLL